MIRIMERSNYMGVNLLGCQFCRDRRNMLELLEFELWRLHYIYKSGDFKNQVFNYPNLCSNIPPDESCGVLQHNYYDSVV